MALFKILGSGLSYFCTGSLLLNFGLSLGAYAQPISVPDLTVMVVADGRVTIVGHQHVRSDTHPLRSQRSKQP